jgi:hypothetical protein
MILLGVSRESAVPGCDGGPGSDLATTWAAPPLLWPQKTFNHGEIVAVNRQENANVVLPRD